MGSRSFERSESPLKPPPGAALHLQVAFIKQWLSWADAHVELLKLTKVVPHLSQPSAGPLDGTFMVQAGLLLRSPFVHERSSPPCYHHRAIITTR